MQIDIDKIKSILKMTKLELDIITKIPVSENSASKLAKDYYEIIKELMTALLLSYGLKSENHECLISFMKQKYPQYEYEINIVYTLKNIRNRVSYDGFFVEKHYLESNKLEFEHIIDLFNSLIKTNVPKLGQTD